MDVIDVYYVGGFGLMGWVSASDYDRSQPDPLADSTAEIIQHMNADHKDALALLARTFARIEATEATMTAVDRLGFHVRIKTVDGLRGARIAFLREASNPAETRKVLVEMLPRPRFQARSNGAFGTRIYEAQQTGWQSGRSCATTESGNPAQLAGFPSEAGFQAQAFLQNYRFKDNK